MMRLPSAIERIVVKFQSLNYFIVSIWQMSPLTHKFAFVSRLPNLCYPPVSRFPLTWLEQRTQIKEMLETAHVLR